MSHGCDGFPSDIERAPDFLSMQFAQPDKSQSGHQGMSGVDDKSLGGDLPGREESRQSNRERFACFQQSFAHDLAPTDRKILDDGGRHGLVMKAEEGR